MAWTPPPLIDPALELTADERRAVRRAAWKRWHNDPKNRAINVAAFLGPLLAYLFLPDLIEPWLGGHRWFHTLIWTVLYVASLVVLVLLLRRFGYAPRVYGELQARGHDVCLRCGYMLAGLPPDHTRCPECGVERVRRDP